MGLVEIAVVMMTRALVPHAIIRVRVRILSGRTGVFAARLVLKRLRRGMDVVFSGGPPCCISIRIALTGICRVLLIMAYLFIILVTHLAAVVLAV